MKVFHSTSQIPVALKDSVLTIGNFDGVHKGHRALLEETLKQARDKGVPSVVLTFDPHPLSVLRPEKRVFKIFDREDQIEQMRSLDIDILVIEPFSRDLSETSPERFFENTIRRVFHPSALVVGHDFSFGAKRAGNIETLKSLSPKLGFSLTVIPAVKVGGTTVSSSEIRKAVASGEMGRAGEFLGRPFYIQGVVEKGDGRGKQIGVPTANLRTHADTLPAKGVYVIVATIQGRRYGGLTNVGDNPTFRTPEQDQPLRIETHLLDLNANLYGEPMKLEFFDYLRPERKFPSVEELVRQIQRDLDQGRARLGKIPLG